jgi:alpha-amylase
VSGVCCIADIVINHRSAWRQDSSGHWNLFEGGTEDERLDWGPWAVVDDDSYDSGGKGQHDTGASYEAAPDLDHTNKRVQDELSDWMNWMKADVGFDGWRFDFVKGYAAEFVKL